MRTILAISTVVLFLGLVFPAVAAGPVMDSDGVPEAVRGVSSIHSKGSPEIDLGAPAESKKARGPELGPQMEPGG